MFARRLSADSMQTLVKILLPWMEQYFAAKLFTLSSVYLPLTPVSSLRDRCAGTKEYEANYTRKKIFSRLRPIFKHNAFFLCLNWIHSDRRSCLMYCSCTLYRLSFAYPTHLEIFQTNNDTHICLVCRSSRI